MAMADSAMIGAAPASLELTVLRVTPRISARPACVNPRCFLVILYCSGVIIITICGFFPQS